MMEQNVGQIDRIIRVILGLIFAVLVYVFLNSIAVAAIFGLLAIIMFVTAALGTCPIYSVIKFSTNKA